MSRKLVASIICISAVFVSFFSFEHETIASEKAQRLCLVNSPAELIACRRGDSLYYQQPGLVHGKYLLDFAAQYCDTNYEINIQVSICTLCVLRSERENCRTRSAKRNRKQ